VAAPSAAIPEHSSRRGHGTEGATRDPNAEVEALFTEANQARRDRDGDRAAALYKRIERRYPASRQADQSYISLGRLLLDRGVDSVTALRQFDGYLARHSGGSLAQEALYGRAVALGRLGRAPQERATWQTLLNRFPGSVYAPRARERLGELR
jgi:outer membrane protein assembly factor BamD (BamD/ComL family)